MTTTSVPLTLAIQQQANVHTYPSVATMVTLALTITVILELDASTSHTTSLPTATITMFAQLIPAITMPLLPDAFTQTSPVPTMILALSTVATLSLDANTQSSIVQTTLTSGNTFLVATSLFAPMITTAVTCHRLMEPTLITAKFAMVMEALAKLVLARDK